MNNYLFNEQTGILVLKKNAIYSFNVRCYAASNRFKKVIDILQLAGFKESFINYNDNEFITSIMVHTRDEKLGYDITSDIPYGNHFTIISEMILDKLKSIPDQQDWDKHVRSEIINEIISEELIIKEEENQMSLNGSNELIDTEEVDTSMDDIKLGQTVWFLAHDKYHSSTVSSIIKSLEYDTKYEVTYLNVKIQLKRNDLWLIEPATVVSIKPVNKVAGLDNAIALAAKYFEGEYDKSGQPYILHCIQVMENVRKWGDVELEIAAVLHDIIEDTEITAFDLLVMGYSQRVVDIVTLVSFEKGCDYDARILEICNSQDAIKVKMADLEHNSMILRMKGISRKDLDRIEKYHRAYFILAAHLEK